MIDNKHITLKDWNLIKGAINRVFARSDLHAMILAQLKVVDYKDPDRKRVKTWLICPLCKKPEAKSYFTVDHIKPKLAPNEEFKDLKSLDEYINRVWCDPSNLQPICDKCHTSKTNAERQLKKAYKDSLKPPKKKLAKTKRK